MSAAIERFNELPEKTKQFLSDLRDDDIDTLADGIKYMAAAKTIGTFVKWLIVGVLGVVTGVIMFAESIWKIISWFRIG